MSDSLVSIIIPVYNVEKYVSYTLEDVCKQTYNNIEIIVVDDGSTDGSGAICDEYAKRNARIFVTHTDNRGLSAARNSGIEMSKGEYIYFLDSDDRVHPELIATLVGEAMTCQCDIVQAGNYAFVDDSLVPRQLENLERRIYSGREMCLGMLDGTIKDSTIVQNKLYRRALFEAGINFPEGRIHEDVATTYRLFWISEKISVINQELFYYRSKRQGSIMHSPFSIARLDSIIAEKERYAFFTGIGDSELAGKSLKALCYTRIWVLGGLVDSGIIEKQRLLEENISGLTKEYKELIRNSYVNIGAKVKIGFLLLRWKMRLLYK